MKITTNNIKDITKTKKCSEDTMILKGYELIDTLFVDTSGFGEDGESALTFDQLQDTLKEILKDNPTIYTAFTGTGQFQAYMGIFKKVSKSKAERISTNVLKINSESGYTIRLYDTDIFTYNSDVITLFSGGYQTKLTKDWINKYLEPFNLFISQKNYEWTVKSFLENTSIEFSDGMTIQL